jgi:hypothetical protein
MKTVADILGVARSNLAEKARRDQRASSSKSPLPRGPYAKPDDLVFLPAIRDQISTEIHAKKASERATRPHGNQILFAAAGEILVGRASSR